MSIFVPPGEISVRGPAGGSTSCVVSMITKSDNVFNNNNLTF